MIVSYTKLIGMPVSELKTQTMVARIVDFIYDNTSPSIAGIVVDNGAILFAKKYVVTAVDFVKLYNEGLIVRDDEAISDFSDAVRLQNLYHDKYFGLGQTVVTESGKNLGKVFDLLFDSETATIQKLHVKNLFAEKLIPASKIVLWEGRTITIKDNRESIPAPSQLEVSSTE